MKRHAKLFKKDVDGHVIQHKDGTVRPEVRVRMRGAGTATTLIYRSPGALDHVTWMYV